jgi:hypothetical protein
VQASVESSAPTLSVDACVPAPAADVAQRLGRWGSVTPLDAAACRVRMEADQLQWPLMALATLDADVSDVSPPEFAALLERVGRRFVAATAAAR